MSIFASERQVDTQEEVARRGRFEHYAGESASEAIVRSVCIAVGRRVDAQFVVEVRGKDEGVTHGEVDARLTDVRDVWQVVAQGDGADAYLGGIIVTHVTLIVAPVYVGVFGLLVGWCPVVEVKAIGQV